MAFAPASEEPKRPLVSTWLIGIDDRGMTYEANAFVMLTGGGAPAFAPPPTNNSSPNGSRAKSHRKSSSFDRNRPDTRACC